MTIEYQRTKKLAKKRKISLKQLNQQAKLGKRTIYNWNTRKPSAEVLAKVAKILQTSTDYLNGLTDNPDPSIKTKKEKTVHLEEQMPYSYHGYHVPEKYLQMLRRLMAKDIKEGKVKHGK